MTTAELRDLAAAAPADATRAAILRAMHAPRSAKGYTKALKRSWTPSLDPVAAWNTYQKHGTLKAAAAELGVTAETVRMAMKSAGCRTAKSRWTEQELEQLRAYAAMPADSRPTVKQFAKSMNRTATSVHLKLGRLGVESVGGKAHRKTKQGEQQILPWKRWTKFEHPRGMAGKKHRPELRAAQSVRSREMWESHRANGNGLMSKEHRQRRSDQMLARNLAAIEKGTNTYSRCKRGRRADLGEMFFCSAWEANIARYLNFLIKRGDVERWEYESETFWFEKIRRGVRSYTPDFKVWSKGGGDPYFIEVKGWMDKKSATKLKRMKKYHPNVRIDVIDEKRYRGIARTAGPLIPGWESKRLAPCVRIHIAAGVTEGRRVGV